MAPYRPRRRGHLGFPVLVLCVVWLLSFLTLAFVAESALAAPYPQNPTEPFSEPAFGEYAASCSALEEGEEPSTQPTKEIWKLRVQTVVSCESSSNTAEVLALRLFWVTHELLRTQESIAKLETTLHKDLTVSGGVPTKLEGVSSGSPLFVKDSSNLSSTDAVAESVDASGEAIKGAVWYLVGLCACGLIGYAVYRQVMPRG